MSGIVYPLGFDLSNLGKGLLENAFSPDLSKKYVKLDETNQTDSRDLSRSLQYSPTYVISSPKASVTPSTTFSSKKEATVSQTQTPSVTQSGFTPQEQSTPTKEGLGQSIIGNMTGILIIGAIIGGGYLILKNKK